MMGFVKKFVLKGMLALFLVACSICVMGDKQVKAGTTSHRAVWVCFYEYASAGLSNRTEAAFKRNAETLFKSIKNYGCNEVYFHVRAFDDAIYPSKIVGWSSYMCSDKRSPGYDPLKILVEKAHEQKLKIHAWMNPYRISYSKILNPGKAKSINRIVSQVKEIIDNYDVDGIHFDDYFYLGSKYNKVKAATKRKNVNKLIKKVYATVKAKSKDLEFGISPAGNIEYSMSIGGDVKTWLSNKGYIDYIVPQIYWSDQYKLSGTMHKLFTERLDAWRSLNKIDLPMYIGLGVYRAGLSKKAVKPDYGWAKKSTNLVSQLKKIKNGNSEGFALFAYSDVAGSKARKEMNKFLIELGWISLNKTSVTIKKGDTFKLVANWAPSKNPCTEDIDFRSLDGEIAVVDKNGVISALKEGKCKVQAISGDKVKTCTVTVED